MFACFGFVRSLVSVKAIAFLPSTISSYRDRHLLRVLPDGRRANPLVDVAIDGVVSANVKIAEVGEALG
ncbi:MAG: hypothetical protein F6K35_22275 [Okeania sp. SIO2H7]|nr:hypothetical protein [Okeania sp. SIO2H7]